MTLERWDPLRRRWIFYASQQEQSADCRANPFEKVPGKIFLDTNVVNLIVKWPEQVFENVPAPMSVDEKTAHDIEALMHVFFTGQRAYWELAASAKTIEEISNTPDEDVRERLMDYAIQVADQISAGSRHGRDLGRRLNDSTLLSALPDPNDRELLGNAIGMGCDVFCTRDHKTIIKKRHLLPALPLRILTPVEWWQTIKPWAGLWC
ncbi:hypothetical protein [Sphingomonas sp. PR090111-T3T-6A]|uniref:hypothetical protein n=1 Tax=Sphingomonas sp. PR090111-T3T-6A TaxID=685778 RepID=UPI00036BF1A2|nr:hypothetical protein [Sphingomonas sp. PR090111-T3T-6A]